MFERVGGWRLKPMSRYFIIILIMGSLVGCSRDVKDDGNQFVNATTVPIVEDNNKAVSIPFKEHLYTKHSSSFTWEWSNTEYIPKDITDKYKELENSVPGGFMVKETPTEYYICVSIGEQESVTKGFEVKSLSFQDKNIVEAPMVQIEVNRVTNDNPSDKELQGKVHVRRLISVSKEDLPDGIKINAFRMGLEE